MGALALGILAALCWGVHDLCVRRVSRRAPIATCLLIVLVVGALAQLPLLALPGGGTGEGAGADTTEATAAGITLAPRSLVALLATGGAFATASYALYRAFAVGPVRLVAPLVGAYPVATSALAAFGGASFGAGHWTAVLAVVAGIALVAAGTDGPRRYPLAPTFGWSLLSALAFATTFSIGQALAARLDPAAVSLGTRLAACLALGLGIVVTRTWRLPERADWPVLALMGLLDAVALGAVLLAGRQPDAVLASVTASLFGAVTIVLARVFLAEAMNARQWLGVGVAFAAIGWLSAG